MDGADELPLIDDDSTMFQLYIPENFNCDIKEIESNSKYIDSILQDNDESEHCDNDAENSENEDDRNRTSSTEFGNAVEANEMLLELQTELREIYTEADDQVEVSPRITKIVTFVRPTREENADDVDQEKDDELQKIFKYLCHLCLIEFNGVSEVSALKKHSESHFNHGKLSTITRVQHGPSFQCEVCDEFFHTRRSFVIHQRDHLNIKPFICNVCHRCFSSLQKLEKHKVRHASQQQDNNNERYSCSYCDKTFAKKTDLVSHERTHSGDKPLTCNQCQKKFSNSTTLRNHEKRHSTGLNLACEECGKAYNNKTSLHRHEQIHLKVKKFPCHLCDKGFCSNAERRRHLLYHFKTKKFKCEECDKAFYESGHLKMHMKIHTNHKPFACEVCGKGFPVRTKLRRHFKMHKNVAPQLLKKIDKAAEVTPKKPEEEQTKTQQENHPKRVIIDRNAISNILETIKSNADNNNESYIAIEGVEYETEDGQFYIDVIGVNNGQLLPNPEGYVYYIVDNDDTNVTNT